MLFWNENLVAFHPGLSLQDRKIGMEPSTDVRRCHSFATLSTSKYQNTPETSSRLCDDDLKMKERLNWTNHASDWTASQWTILRSCEDSLKYFFIKHGVQCGIMDLCQIITGIRGFMRYYCRIVPPLEALVSCGGDFVHVCGKLSGHHCWGFVVLHFNVPLFNFRIMLLFLPLCASGHTLAAWLVTPLTNASFW